MLRHDGGAFRGRVGVLFALLAMVTSLLVAMAGPASAGHEGNPPTIVGPETEANKLGRCTGVDRGDPGEENTNKFLTGGSLVPGGTAEYLISFPAEEEEATATFRVLDCLFADDEAIALYEISNITKHVLPDETAFFEFALTVNLPADLPLGTQICNVAQTIGQETGSPASNRKTGDECFILGGTLVVKKVVTGTSDPLPGAVFRIQCVSSDSSREVIISPAPNADDLVTTPATGVISIAGPEGSTCLITEVSAPGGFVIDDPTTKTVQIPRAEAGSEVTVTFTNSRVGNLVITKVTTGGSGTFTFNVDCEPGAAFDQTVTITDSGSRTITGIPAGTVCTVTENSASGFSSTVIPGNGAVTIAPGDNTVAFTNVRQTGDLVVSKTTTGGTGTFSFTVDCNPGTAFDQTFTLTNNETRRISGIPTGTTCVVTEAANALFTSVVTPANGTVVIGGGDNTVSFVNSARPPVLTITKTADAPSVTAGSPIGFTVTVANTGSGPATAVTLNDPLPGGTGISWAISPAYTGPGTCAVTGTAPSQTLSCSFGDLAPGATVSVHVSSATTAATSGTFTNTAVAQAANHPQVSATASVAVTPAAVVQGVVITQQPGQPPAVLGQTLARTGVNSLAMAVAGWGFIGLGLVFRSWGMRRPDREVPRARRRR